MEQKDVIRLLKEREGQKVPLSITLSPYVVKDLKKCAKLHKLTVSAMAETALMVGMTDPYIREKKEVDPEEELY